MAGAPIRLVIVLGLVNAIGPLSIDMYLPAFPDIASDLDTSAAQVQLTLTACVAGLAAGQLVIGPLSDRLRRPAGRPARSPAAADRGDEHLRRGVGAVRAGPERAGADGAAARAGPGGRGR